MEKNHLSYESAFDINKVSFSNVNKDFEHKFKERYEKSLYNMSDTEDPLSNASGVNSLGLLEEMARRINDYDKNSSFEKSYHDLIKEFEPFSET